MILKNIYYVVLLKTCQLFPNIINNKKNAVYLPTFSRGQETREETRH